MLDQIGIALTGCIAIWLSQDVRASHRRWACIFGLIGQPFWFYAAWQAGQWGIFALSFIYTASWLKGLWNNWLVPVVVDHRRAQEKAERLAIEAAKSERRAIAFGDVIQSHVIAMRAAVVAAANESPDRGIEWIQNTLRGPGHLPNIDIETSAQALWDRETAEHEAFRAKHPAPEVRS